MHMVNEALELIFSTAKGSGEKYEKKNKRKRKGKRNMFSVFIKRLSGILVF